MTSPPGWSSCWSGCSDSPRPGRVRGWCCQRWLSAAPAVSGDLPAGQCRVWGWSWCCLMMILGSRAVHWGQLTCAAETGWEREAYVQYCCRWRLTDAWDWTQHCEPCMGGRGAVPAVTLVYPLAVTRACSPCSHLSRGQ